MVLSVSDDNTTRLDGFTITVGRATGGNTIDVETKTISPGIGAGLYIESGNPGVYHCTISSNYANASGGGIYNNNANPWFVSCVFNNNQADNTGGGE
ncbi:MAG: hypothetical protein IPH16_10715 [Haliscomenobacter sp.]|nr:hypothetical protein [Haliscomenobacter sp.]